MARFCRTCGCDRGAHPTKQEPVFSSTGRQIGTRTVKLCPLRPLTKEERVKRELPAASSGGHEEAARFVVDRSQLVGANHA